MASQLSFEQAKKFLKKHRFPQPKELSVKSWDEAKAAASKVGYPVVLKIFSSKILHKSDVGGVKIDIRNEEELKKAYRKLSRIRGIESLIVQEMIPGKYVIIGMKRDSQFGPVVLVGAGGIYVEILKDFSMRIAPVTLKEAKEMIKELKIYPILAGARGQEKVNLNLLAKIIHKVSELAMKDKSLQELDFNPVVVNKKGGAIVDAKIIVSAK